MNITKSIIKRQFSKSEKNLHTCWVLLTSVKNKKFSHEGFGSEFLSFQDTLAQEIFDLYTIREHILTQEREYIKNKAKYKLKWFESKMRILAHYKRGVEAVSNIAKSLGDAYAYFFYQFDLELLEEHSHHNRVTNSTAGVGELGELEFTRQVKYLHGYFTLYHGITNILRYGDYTFINLDTRKVAGIGELKSSKTGENTITSSLVFIGHKDEEIFKLKSSIPSEKRKENKREKKLQKQVTAISKLFSDAREQENKRVDLNSDFYYDEINALYKSTKFNSHNAKQVSAGLIFSGIKYKKSGFFNKLYLRNPAEILNQNTDELTDLVTKVIKLNSGNNSIIYDQLLYTPEFLDKKISGTVPLFWQPLDETLLKKLYFLEYLVISLFNPIHIIDEVESLGFSVESKYAETKLVAGEFKGVIQRFDRFFPYITNFLHKESFIIDSINSVKNLAFEENMNVKALIKPQQITKIF